MFVILGEFGEYSERTVFVAGVTHDENKAREFVGFLTKTFNELYYRNGRHEIPLNEIKDVLPECTLDYRMSEYPRWHYERCQIIR